MDKDALPGEEVHLLTWIDDLFDTRISTMFNYDIMRTLELIPTGYDIRTCDNFIWEGLGITATEWDVMFANRDDDILLKSVRTAVPDFIRELISEQVRYPIQPDAIKSPITLTINTYPYYLTDEVKKGLTEVYQEIIHPYLDIRYIRKSYDKLSSAYVVNNYTMVLHYDYDKWLYAAGENSEKASLVTLQVVGPRIWKDAPSLEECDKYKEEMEHFDIHMLAEMACALVFQLTLVPVDLWVAYKTNHKFSQATHDVLWPDAGTKPADVSNHPHQ